MPDEKKAITAAEISDNIKFLKDNRKRWEIQAWINMHFIDGNNVYWSNTLDTVQTVPTANKNTDTKSVNFGRKLLRGAKNIITANEPRWQIRNSDGIDASTEEKDAAHKYLQSIYRKEGMRGLIKDAMDYAFLRTFCIASVLFDSEKKDVDIELWDPLDIYVYPVNPDPAEWEYVITCHQKEIDELKNDPKYSKYKDKLEKISTKGQRLYESDVKNSFQEAQGEKAGDNTVILHQKIYRVYDGAKYQVRIAAKVGEVLIRDEELKDYECLDEIFAILFAERRAGQLYFTPWMTDVTRLNEILNRNFTNVDEYDRLLAKGRWLVMQGSEMSNVSTTQHGQIVKYRGQKPEPMDIPPLPPSVFEHRNFLLRMMEDISGVHSESLGRQSGSADSGRALSILVAQDQQNVSEPVDNLEDFLAQIGRLCLKCASKYFSEIKTIYFDNKDKGEEEKIEIVGADATKNLDAGKIVVGKDQRDKAQKVYAFEDVDVQIIPGSAFSDIQAFEMLLRAREANIQIPDSEIIESMKMGNARDFLRRYQEEVASEDAKDPDTLIAEGKVKKIITEGVLVPPDPADDLQIHLAIFGQTLQAIGPTHPSAPLLMQYMDLAEQLLGQSPSQVPTPLNNPQGGLPSNPV